MFKRKAIRIIAIILLIIALLVITAMVAFAMQPKTVIDSSNPVGLIDSSYLDSERSRELNLYMWYPTDATDTVELFEDNAVFRGFSAIKDAPISEGTYPLILFSHGSGGNRGNQSWLAVELARQGAIVVAANHPGSTSRDSAPATNILTWNRPADISFLIDSLLADPKIAPYIDSERIAMVGHSLGGYTTLAIGGAELNLDQFIAYCTEFPNNADCLFYRSGDVDLTQVDRSQFEQANRDERVSAIVSIDPAYARSFKPKSLETLTDLLLIAAPVPEGSMGDLKVDDLGEQLALGENFITMDGAHHFTYLPECKPLGYYLLMVVEKGGELLCATEEGQSRVAYQGETTASIINFFEEQAILGQ